MIKAVIYLGSENENNRPYGFRVTNHGRGIVCAAVSMLCLNTVNSLEVLTDVPLEYCYDIRGGYLECILDVRGDNHRDALLLLDSLILGLQSVAHEYGFGKNGILLTTETHDFDALIAPSQNCKVFKR